MRTTRAGRVSRGVALLAAGALVLSGCAAGNVGAGGADEGAELEDDAAQFLSDRGEELGVDSISVLAQASPQANAIEAMSSQFTEATGIEVKWTILDEQSTENKAAVALGSDGGFDVLQTPSGLVPSYLDRDWLASIDDLADDPDSIVPGWDLEAFGEGTNALLSRDGKQYGVPMFIGTQVFYYRTDVFAEAGIESPPSTYAELAEVAEKIDSDDVSGIALRTAPSVSQLLFVWSAWLYAHGGSYYSDFSDGDYSGVALDSPEAAEALTLFCDLVQKHAPSGATNWSVDDVTRAFLTGRVGMVQEGAVFGGTFNDPDSSQVADKIDTFTLPAGDAGTFVPYNTHGWTIAGNSKKADAAWLFLQWATMASTLTAATQTDANFGSPPLAEVYESPEYAEKYGFGDFVPTVTNTITVADEGGVAPFEGDPNYTPGTSDWATVGQQVSEELSRAVTGQVSPETALEAAARHLE